MPLCHDTQGTSLVFPYNLNRTHYNSVHSPLDFSSWRTLGQSASICGTEIVRYP